MARLIDADVMIEYLRKQLCDNCHEQKDWCDVCDYAYLIDEMKKVPTVEPKHGHWINKGFEPIRCSLCGITDDAINGIPWAVKSFKYCPNCGAKMDEVKE